MFDSHCHLDASEYDEDRRDVLTRAREAGVRGILVPGYEPEEWLKLPAFCAQDPLLKYALGLHPWYVHKLSEAELSRALSELSQVVEASDCVAIGECGLDAIHAKRGGAALSLQERVLTAHLTVCRQVKLPIILHCVGAHARLLELLEAQAPLPCGGVLHSYSGPAELVPRYMELGLHFSFAGIVTREEAKRPHRALCAVPRERLLVESDGPDQAARTSQCRRSEPAHVRYVLEAAAQLRKEPYEQLVRDTTDNALRLFGGV